jgi:hypothetical protein
MAQENADRSAASIGTSALLDGLEAEARRDRAQLVAWLMRRRFTADEIAASVTPMLLPANRVMGDDGVYVSTREMAHATGIDLELLQAMQRAAGLPRIDDPDAAVLPRADVEAATRAKYLLDFGVDPDDMLAIVRVLAEGLRRGAAMMREPTFKAFAKPGASEVDVAESADALAQAVIPSLKRMVEGLIPVKKVLTPQITTASASTRRHRAFGGGGRERLSGREPPPRSCALCGWRRSISVTAELRVYGRRPHKRRIPTSRPTDRSHHGDTSRHTSHSVWTSCRRSGRSYPWLVFVSAGVSVSAVANLRQASKPDVCAATSQNVVGDLARWTHTFVEHLDQRQGR